MFDTQGINPTLRQKPLIRLAANNASFFQDRVL
jgi:hypothetical protein